MDSGITNRLAIVDVDFEEITLPTIFKMIESIVNQRIIKISLYNRNNVDLYLVCEFKSKEYARIAYDSLDGVEIEKTGNVFNMSFIPDDLELDTLVSECTDSEKFKEVGIKNKKIDINEDMIELSNECEIDFEIPEEFKSKDKPVIFDYEKGYKPIPVEDKEASDHHILEALKEDDSKDQEEDNFIFDPLDNRFKDLYEDEDFSLDASNKKFKLQKSSKVIIDQKFKTTEDEI